MKKILDDIDKDKYIYKNEHSNYWNNKEFVIKAL